MHEIDANRVRDIGLITRYFGRGPESWHKEILDGYDFSPRWLSQKGCAALGLKSLVVFQGMPSPLEDMGEDARYEHQADNTIAEGIHLLENKVAPGQRLLVYKPGTGAEAVHAALRGVHVTALCTSAEERSNVEVNAWLNGVSPENLEIVGSLPGEFRKFDAAYFNAPRPVYPEKSSYRGIEFLHFESDSRKFDKEGETSNAFFRLAQEGIAENGQVFCIGPNIPSYRTLIYQAGFNANEMLHRQMHPLGDLRAFVLFKDDRHVLDHADLATLLEKSVDPSETAFLRQCAKQKLRDRVSRFSETGIDKDIPAGAHDYFGVLMAAMPDDLISYLLVDLLTRTRQCGTTMEQLKKNVDESILAFETHLAGLTALRDPFTPQGLREIAQQAIALSEHHSGVFVKTQTLWTMLKHNPPEQLIAAYQKHSLDELLETMDPQTVFSLGRYIEKGEWTKRNQTLCENLQPDDFEKRPIRIVVFETLPPNVVQYFEGKLPFSNDKVAGTLTGFPVPPSEQNRVPRLRALTRALHYLHELNFYSEIVRGSIPGALDQEQSIGKILSKVLGEDYNVDQFFESHAMAEVFFMVQTLEDLKKSDTLPCPKEWKGLPFSLGVVDGKDVQWTSIIDRITALSKGYDSDLHARRYLRLAPLLYFYGEGAADPLRLLVSTYAHPEFIPVALEQGWSLTRLHSSRDIAQITSDYPAKVHAYLETLARSRPGKTSALGVEDAVQRDALSAAAL